MRLRLVLLRLHDLGPLGTGVGGRLLGLPRLHDLSALGTAVGGRLLRGLLRHPAGRADRGDHLRRVRALALRRRGGLVLLADGRGQHLITPDAIVVRGQSP